MRSHAAGTLGVLIALAIVAPRPAAADDRLGDDASFEAVLEALPERGWARIDTNSPDDVFPHEGTRYQPDSQIRRVWSAWAGFAYVEPAQIAILFGGGHGNTSYNGPFHFDLKDRKWHRSFLPTRTFSPRKDDDNPHWPEGRYAVDGYDVESAPISPHPYQTNVYLPALDRFAAFGGAIWGQGGPYRKYDYENSHLGPTGPYILNYHLFDPDKVASKTGSNYRADEVLDPGQHPGEIEGADAWSLIDKGVGQSVNGHADVRVEDGVDVIYTGTSALLRWEIREPLSESTRTEIGIAWITTRLRSHTGALFDHVDAFVTAGDGKRSSGHLFTYWDVSNQDRAVKNVEFEPDKALGFPGEAAGLADRHLRQTALRYDPVRERGILMDRQGRIWALHAPGTLGPSGWWTERLDNATADSPSETGRFENRGVHGMWQYMPDHDAFLHMSATGGEVWVWKPDDWQPR